MLIKFTVANFLSFNDETTFSMVAGKSTSLQHHVISKRHRGDIRVLKTGVLYGANASGKSNFVRAINFAQDFIINGRKKGNSIQRSSFKLDEKGKDKVSKFQFEIKIKEKIYAYGFTVNDLYVIDEWLYQVGPKINGKMIFERSTDNNENTVVTFGEIGLKNKNDILYLSFTGTGTPLNRLFLTETYERGIKNVQLFKDIYEWFSDKLVIIFPESKYAGLEFNIKSNNDLSKDFIDFLRYFSTGIESFDLKEVDLEKIIPVNPDNEKLRRDIVHSLEKGGKVLFNKNENVYVINKNAANNDIVAERLMTVHLSKMKDNKILFEINEESDGTRRLFDLIPALIGLVKQEKIFIIDELDRSLHPNLTIRFIKLFIELSFGNTSQLIVTTHEASLLDLNFLRKDEIWFTEKNEYGETQVYSMEEFKPRNDKEIRKGYLLGRFGAIPLLKFSDKIVI